MGLVPRFTMAQVRQQMENRMERIENAIVMRLQALGTECVNEARSEGTYTDQTGNLRASVGYIITKYGRVIKTAGFDKPFGKTGGQKGKTTGKDFANSLAAEYPLGYALIVVAGMEYAAKVETGGKNVLSTAKHYAETELPAIMQELKYRIGRMK